MAKKEDKKAPVDEKEIGTTEGGDVPPKKKSGKLKLILIVVIAMAIGGGGAFAALKFLGGGSSTEVVVVEEGAKKEAAPAAPAEEPIVAPSKDGADAGAEVTPAEGAAAGGEAGAEGAVPAGPQVVAFKPFIVNLTDGGGRKLLKISISMKAENQGIADELNANMAQIRDVMLLLLSSLSSDDIATLDGKMRLKAQMLNRTNSVMTKGKIKDLFFDEFVVQ